MLNFSILQVFKSYSVDWTLFTQASRVVSITVVWLLHDLQKMGVAFIKNIYTHLYITCDAISSFLDSYDSTSVVWALKDAK